MKKAMKIVLAMAMVLLMSGGAMAQEAFNAQGSVLVPGIFYSYVNHYNREYPRFIITNTSSNPVQCRVIAYNQDGNELTQYAQISTGGTTGHVQLSTGTGDFDIPAYSTRMFRLLFASAQMRAIGYATIEWKSDDPKQRNALIASGDTVRYEKTRRHASNIVINHGDPF